MMHNKIGHLRVATAIAINSTMLLSLIAPIRIANAISSHPTFGTFVNSGGVKLVQH